MKQSDFPKTDRLLSSFGPDYLTTGLSLGALSASFCLQFLRHIDALVGTSDQAISGATILSVSLVFTGSMFLASYHYARRQREYQGALDEADTVSELIEHGQDLATQIRYKGAHMLR